MPGMVRLLLPVLMPSWRFFSAVAPSPRIEYALRSEPDAPPLPWQEFRPRPARLSVGQMLGRLFWNPRWNESLFLVSCAERLMEEPTEHSLAEIARRLSAGIGPAPSGALPMRYLQFRLVFVRREGAEVVREITHVSTLLRRAEVP